MLATMAKFASVPARVDTGIAMPRSRTNGEASRDMSAQLDGKIRKINEEHEYSEERTHS